MIPAAACILALAFTAQDPTLTASLDKTEVMIGEIVTLTIRAQVDGSAPARLLDPPLSGLELRGSRDVTRVALESGVTRRSITRELRLVAVRAGTATIGPVRLERNGIIGETASLSVRVNAPSAAELAKVTPRLQRVIDTLRPPVVGEGVMVEVLALPDSVMLGEQLDLVTLAWFPRDVRQQLRTPPTLAPPDVQGVWAYRQATTPGVVASRQVGGDWYDLYASHQVVFPLATGPVPIGRATVSYVQPLSYSFLSRELQHEVQSESLTVHVLPQPLAGRPAAFSGAAGTRVTVALAASETVLPTGGTATVDITVAGTGNVALWPEPVVAWPEGLRVYPSGVEIASALEDGRIAGTKRFRFLVIADSAGTLLVPGLDYAYFDTDGRHYDVATAPGVRLIAPPGTVGAPARPLPAPPKARSDPSVADRATLLARWVWVLAFGLPPALAVGFLFTPRIGLPRRTTRRARDRELLALEALDRRLRDTLARRLGPSSHREGAPLAAALRAAGVEATLAQHVTRVRDRLQQAVFGPPGAGDPDELTAEVHAVLGALEGDAPGAERRQLIGAALLLLLVAGPSAAQAPRPEELYEAGAFRAAADSFMARVEREPQVAVYWYNLGAAFYRLGEDGRARAAWVRAARLAPRDPDVQRALRLLPPDPGSHDVILLAPVRPVEAALVALVLWFIGWVALTTGHRRIAALGLLLAGSAAVVAGHVAIRYREPTAIVIADDVPLRSAPYGSADAVRRLAAGAAVRVLRHDGSWVLVDRAGDPGWVRAAEVARL